MQYVGNNFFDNGTIAEVVVVSGRVKIDERQFLSNISVFTCAMELAIHPCLHLSLFEGIDERTPRES